MIAHGALVARIVTGLGIVALTVFRRFEDKNVVRHRLSAVLAGGSGVDELLATVQRLDARVSNVDYAHEVGTADERVELTLDIQIDDRIGVRALASAPTMRRVRIQQA
ncbi:MAG TPA: hypothetical protein VGH28_16560 [Polyangiaceae bacterium]